MKYDFTSIIDRKNKDAMAVDNVGKDPGFAPTPPTKGLSFIPMWVADMSFATAPSVINEISTRLQHPLFGYFSIPDNYYSSIIDWQKTSFNNSLIKKENIGHENGVLSGILSGLRILCSTSDYVLLHSPTYVGFTNNLSNAGYKIASSKLKLDSNNIWRMDYEDMENKIIEHKIHVAIFCSPHNPTGRVWEKEELLKAYEIFKKHNVFVLSDEIWSDLILENKKHIPLQSLNDDAKNRTISYYSPSKTFNLGGIGEAYHVVYNNLLHDRLIKEESLTHYNEKSVLSVHALIGSYTNAGRQWMEELNSVLEENIKYSYEFITKNIKGVSLSKPEGTYMLYLDTSNWCDNHSIDFEDLLNKGYDYGIGWQDGRMFKFPNTIRLNVAIPKSLLIEALDRIKKYIFIN